MIILELYGHSDIKQSCVKTRIDLLMAIVMIGDICIKYRIKYWIAYLPSKWNIIADGLSRNTSTIYAEYPQQPQAIASPVALVQKLLDFIAKNVSAFNI